MGFIETTKGSQTDLMQVGIQTEN